MADIVYPHLHKSVRALVDRPRNERVIEIQRQRFFENPRCQAIWSDVRDLMLTPNGNASNCSILIYADAGVGKSESLQYCRDMVDKDREDAAKANVPSLLRRPLLYSLQKCSADRALINTLSGGLYLQRRPVSEDPSQLLKIIAAWNAAGVGALFLDELSDIGRGQRPQQESCCQTLRMILNTFEAPVVAVSNTGPHEVFAMDANLATRFELVELSRWGPDKDLRNFIENFFVFFPLKFEPSFSDDDWTALLNLLVRLTDGITRKIVRLLRRAAIYAIDSGIECMCLKVFTDMPLVKRLQGLQ